MKLLLSLSSKGILTGIAPGAHSERSGLFHKALGINPIYNPGGVADVENGLLQAGGVATDITGIVVVDTPIARVSHVSGSTAYCFMLGNDGHFYRIAIGGTVTDLRSGTPISSPGNGGLAIYKP